MNFLKLEYSLIFILFAPLFSAVVGALFFRKCRWIAPILSTLSSILCFALACVAISMPQDFRFALTLVPFEIFKLGDFALYFGLSFESLARNMIFVVTFVGMLVHIFSLGYMDDDKARGRFFAGLSFFMFSITGIVFSDNLFMMFIFWELVGFSSYALIAHYSNTIAAMNASKKAFIVNRVGDFGFLLGIIWCYHNFQTVNFSDLANILAVNPEYVSTGIGLLLMCGFLGKSAQFPLQVWLSDAMAGPTPVSALIHAATMVVAGIYMMVKLGFAAMLSPAVLDVILVLCTTMSLLAGIWAIGQQDIKKTLAYSTLAHLGIMGVAIGLGFYGLAMLHLTMHAFFKAALFLCAGSVIHACHHEQDMLKLGGLFKRMPITAIVALVASLSIIAIPFFAGYYSKDTILTSFFAKAINEGSAFYCVLFVMMLTAVFFTPLYIGRFFFLVFCGKSQSSNAEHAHESSLFITLPLIALALYSLAGAWGITFGWNYLIPENAIVVMREAFEHQHHIFGLISSVHAFEYGTLALTAISLGLAYFLYGKGRDSVMDKSPVIYKAIESHGWFDDIYNYYVAKVQQRFAELVNVFDLVFIEGFVIRGLSAGSALAGYCLKVFYLRTSQAYLWWIVGGIAIIGIILAY